MKRGVADRDAGVVSALVNTSQQVGGALGTALLNTIAATATASYLITHHGAVQAGLVHGYRPAFAVSAVVLAVGLVAAFLLIRAGSLTTCPTPTRQTNHYKRKSSVTAHRIHSPRRP